MVADTELHFATRLFSCQIGYQAKVHSTIFWKILVHLQPKFTDSLQNR